jgi:hypothetical protein
VDAMVVGQPEGTSLIAPGASGGAVFDASGAVLGVLIQAFPSGRPPRVSRGAPFAQSLFWQPTGDMAFDGFAGQNFVMKLLDGLREDVGNAGLAIPVMGGARVALAGSVPDILDVEKVVGTMTVFPDGECRTGRVVAYPRVEADRMLGRVDETTVVPVTAQRAWAQLQGTGWYPSEPQDRVIWQALIGLEKSGFPVPAKSVLDLLGKAKWVEGRIGLEATRIEAGLHAGLRQEGYRQANHKGGAEGMMLLKEDFPSRNGRDPAMR